MNDSSTAILIGIGILVPLVFLIVYLVRLEKRQRQKRRDDLRQKAQTLRATFAEEGDAALLAELDKLVRAQHKHHPQVGNVLRGERQGMEFEAADYRFTTGGGKSHQIHNQTVVRCRMAAPVPDFYLRPEHVFDKIGDWVGWHDIDFSHRPDFSQRYFLRGDNESAIRALFVDPALGILERDSEDFCMGGHGDSLLIYRPYRTFVPVEELESYLDKALAVLASFNAR